MKKTITTLTLILGLALTGMAQQGGGLFQRGSVSENTYFNNGGYAYDRETGGLLPGLPDHGSTDNQDAPLTGGVALLLGLGGAYLVAKRRKK